MNERLAAAAEEIVGLFEQTMSVYEEEIARQRRVLDVVLKPEIRLHRTGLKILCRFYYLTNVLSLSVFKSRIEINS